MALKTYLDIVNDSMAECKVSLDPLTSGTFASPPRTALYTHFKRWANNVYRELMLDRPEWFFRRERKTITLYPRLHLSGLTYTPSINDVLKAQNSLVQFTVKGVHSFENNEDDPAIEYTVDVEYASGSDPRDLEVNEVLNRVSPAPASAVGYVAHAGRYNFADDVVGLDEIDIDSVKVFYEDTNIGEKVTPVLWDNWINRYSYYPYGAAARPEYITQAPDGNYEFFPQPITSFKVDFDYIRTYQDMVNYNDTPVGVPEKYDEILVWLVVAEFADFDNNTRLFARAQKKLDKFGFYLFRDELPKVGIERSRFNVDYGW